MSSLCRQRGTEAIVVRFPVSALPGMPRPAPVHHRNVVLGALDFENNEP